MWRSTYPTLKIADGANTDPRTLGQFFLRQAGGGALLSQQFRKRRRT
jgi:hypothetical protein